MVKSFPGVRTKECIRNNKKDIYFSICYTRNGKQYEESIGYKSEGFTAAQAYEILSELKRDIKTGKALSLREKTEQREQEKIANEAANMTFSELFEEYYQPHIQNKDKKSTYDREVHLYKKWLYDTYLTPMCERVYNMYYSPTENIEARALARWIIENKPQSFILRDVYNNGNVPNLRRKEQAETAANRLIDLNWLSCKSSRAGNTAGRSRKTYYVNPEVYESAENY